MIREFIKQAGVGFFTRIEEDYLENPDVFFARARQMVGEYAPSLGAFVRWGASATERYSGETHFMSGALMMLEALHRFDAMSGGDAEFFTKLCCLSDEFCERSGAALCDSFRSPHEVPRDFVSFYVRPIKEVSDRNCVLSAFLTKYGRGLRFFELGALAIAELFFRFEEQGLMSPEKDLLN